MAAHLIRKVNRLNLLLPRRLLCRHCSSGSQDSKGDKGNKGDELATDPASLPSEDDRTLPMQVDRDNKQLAQLREMYEGSGVEVVKHEMDRGITRRAGVTFGNSLLCVNCAKFELHVRVTGTRNVRSVWG